MLLAEKGLPVTEVSDYTGFPEDDGWTGEDPASESTWWHSRGPSRPGRCHYLEEHQIQPIDMVVVNLYPFAQTVAREGCSLEDAGREHSISAARRWCAPPPRTIKMSQSW